MSDTSSLQGPERGARTLLACALALGAGLMLWHVDLPLSGSEGRWLVVAREMVQAGDPFAMTMDGKPYLDKPFGSYWLVIIASWVMGGLTEAAARMPGVLAYLATLAVTYLIGKRTLGARAGAVAALLLATSLRLLFWGRTASADPQDMLGTTLALLLVLEVTESGRTRTWVLLGLVAGLTTLMKGLIGVALPVFVVGLWTLTVREPRRWLPWRGALACLAACLLIAGAPFLVAHWVQGGWEPLRLLWRESVTRAVDPFDHTQPWWYYLVDQFELLAAWSLLLPAALLLAFTRLARAARDGGGWWMHLRASEAARRQAFPLFCYLAILLFLDLSLSRRSYYLMPIAPFAALLVAQALLAVPAGLVARLRAAGLILLGVVGVMGGAAALVVGLMRLAADTPPSWLAARLPPFHVDEAWKLLPAWLPLLAVVIVPAVHVLRHATGRAPLPAITSILVMTSVLALGVAEPIRGHSDRLPRFGAAVRAIVPPEEIPGIIYGSNARLLYYLGPAPGTPGLTHRFRAVLMKDLPSFLAAEPAWTRVKDPRLAAAAWPDSDSNGYVLMQAPEAAQ